MYDHSTWNTVRLLNDAAKKTRVSHLHNAAPALYFLAVVVPSFCPFMALKKNGKEANNIFALRVSNAKPYEDC
jgi:hypothetical protein